MGMLRTLAGVLGVGSVIAFFIGITNLGGFVQVGGDDGFIYEAGFVVLGSIILGTGSVLAFLGTTQYQQTGSNATLVLGLGLMIAAGVMAVTLGQTPMEYCGSRHCT